MSDQKIKIQEQNSGSLMMIGSYECTSSRSLENLSPNQPWNMGICFQSRLGVQVGTSSKSIQKGLNDTPGIVSSHFGSPTSAFYSTESCMSFQRGNYDVDELSNSTSPLPQESLELQPATAPISLNIIQAQRSRNNVHQDLYRNSPGSALFPPILQRSADELASLHRTQSHISFNNHDNQGPAESQLPCSLYWEFPSNRNCPLMSRPSMIRNKTRIRWNQDLHNRFVECVNRLGGAEKATPKAILKLMDIKGLTIYHVKSHLQKYRIARYIPESAEGKSDRITANGVTRTDRAAGIDRNGRHEIIKATKRGVQIAEALQLQKDVQRDLHEQMEIQRNLQSRIEEQGRQLKSMIDYQLKTRKNLDEMGNFGGE